MLSLWGHLSIDCNYVLPHVETPSLLGDARGGLRIESSHAVLGMSTITPGAP